MKMNILEQYKILVDFLGKTLGPDYEVVLQDLTDQKNAIVAIANNTVSGRQIGSPLTDAALKMLSSKAYKDHDFIYNYKGVSENGHVLRSSTMFIKDETGEPIGLLCINFDDSRYLELSKKLFSTIHPASFSAARPDNRYSCSDPIQTQAAELDPYSSITEVFPTDISSLMQKIFDDATSHLSTPVDHLNQYERKEIMIQLKKQGMFELKGAVPFTAKKFSCSIATVYRYLNEIGDLL